MSLSSLLPCIYGNFEATAADSSYQTIPELLQQALEVIQTELRQKQQQHGVADDTVLSIINALQQCIVLRYQRDCLAFRSTEGKRLNQKILQGCSALQVYDPPSKLTKAFVGIIEYSLSQHVEAVDIFDIIGFIRQESRASKLRIQLLVALGDAFRLASGPSAVFDMHGTHGGLIAPVNIMFPNKKGYSITFGVLIDPEIWKNQSVPLYWFRGSKGHGISCIVEGTSLILRTYSGMGHDTSFTVDIADELNRMKAGKWIVFAITHSKSLMFKNIIKVYADGKLRAEGALSYPNVVLLQGGQNCFGTAPGVKAFQGQMWTPTLYSIVLSLEQIQSIQWTNISIVNSNSRERSAHVLEQDYSAYISFAYDSRNADASTSACYDCSGHGHHGWMEPATRTIFSRNLAQALTIVGGPVSLMSFIIPSPHYLSLQLVAPLNDVETTAVFQIISIALESDFSNRAQFINSNGLHICAHLLLRLSRQMPEYLTIALLKAVSRIANAFYPHDITAFCEALSLLLFNIDLWRRANLDVQFELLRMVLPDYLRHVDKIPEDRWPKYCTKLSVPYICYALEQYSLQEDLDEQDAITLCRIIVRYLLESKAMMTREPGFMRSFQTLIYYIHRRCDEFNASGTREGLDICTIWAHMEDILSDEAAASTSSPPGSLGLSFPWEILRAKIFHLGGMALFWKPLACRSVAVRDATLRLICALQTSFSYSDALMVYSNLKTYPFSPKASLTLLKNVLQKCEIESANEKHVLMLPLLALLPTAPAESIFICLSSLIDQMQVEYVKKRTQLGESIRLSAQWMNSYASIVMQESRFSPMLREENVKMDTSITTAEPGEMSLSEACNVLSDSSASINARKKAADAIGCLGSEFGCDVLISVLTGNIDAMESTQESPCPKELRDHVRSVLFTAFEARGGDLVRHLACINMAQMISYCLQSVDKGWIYVLEAHFLFRGSEEDFIALMLLVVKDLKPRLRNLSVKEAEVHSLLWENLSQFSSILTIHLLNNPTPLNKATSKFDSALYALANEIVLVWIHLAPHTGSISWSNLKLANSAQNHEISEKFFIPRLDATILALVSSVRAIRLALAASTSNGDDIVIAIVHLRMLLETFGLIMRPMSSPLPDEEVAVSNGIPEMYDPDSHMPKPEMFHLWMIEECHDMLQVVTAMRRPKLLLIEIITSLATEALVHVSPEVRLAPGLLGIISADATRRLSDVSDDNILSALRGLWGDNIEICIGASAAQRLQTEIDRVSCLFMEKWGELASSQLLFDVEIVRQEAEIRTALLHSEHQRVNDSLYWMNSGFLQSHPDEFTPNEKLFKKHADQMVCLVGDIFHLLDENLPGKKETETSSYVKLSAKENDLRMRYRQKEAYNEPNWGTVDREVATSITMLQNLLHSPVGSPSHGGLQWSMKSDSGSDYCAILANSDVRAAILARSRHNSLEELGDFEDDLDMDIAMVSRSSEAEEGKVGDDHQTNADRLKGLAGNVVSLVGRVASDARYVVDAGFDRIATAKDGILIEADAIISEGRGSVSDAVADSDAEVYRTGCFKKNHKTIMSCQVQLIRKMRIICGKLSVAEDFLIFQGEELQDVHGKIIAPDSPKLEEYVKKQRVWSLNQLKGIYRRRYLLRSNALELFVKNSAKTYFFNFLSKGDEMIEFHKSIMAQLPLILRDNPMFRRLRSAPHVYRSSDLCRQWQNYEISTFEYLMQLNTIAGRTYHDLTQYPIFPWILQDYKSSSLDLSSASTFRDLSRPIGALEPTRLQHYLTRYKSFDDPNIPPFMYGTHYSHPGAVLYYLLRVEPFTTYGLAVQGGKFDHADRLFFSIPETWQHCLEDQADLKELTPEWFYYPQFLVNGNHIDFGKRQNGKQVNDVVLPPWASDAYDFIFKNRMALESEYVSAHLHHWIDLIFGYKQLGEAAEEAHNVFFHLTYEGMVDLDAVEDVVIRESMQAQIAHFGQTPSQLLFEPHPQRIPDFRRPQTPSTSVLHEFKNYHKHSIVRIGYCSRTQEFCCIDTSGRYSSHKQAVIHLSDGENEVVNKTSTPTSELHLKSLSSDMHWQEAVKYFYSGENDGILHQMVFVAEGMCVVIGGQFDNSARVYSLADPTQAHRIQQHSSRVSCVEGSPDGSVLALGTVDGNISLWNVTGLGSGLMTTLQRFRERKVRIVRQTNFDADRLLLGHAKEITCICVSEAMNLCVSGSVSGLCLVHDLTDGSILNSLKFAYSGRITAVSISLMGYILVEVGSAERITLYSFQLDGTCVGQLRLDSRLRSIDPLRRSMHAVIATASALQLICVHTLEIIKNIVTVTELPTEISCHLILPRERIAIVGLKNGTFVSVSIECG